MNTSIIRYAHVSSDNSCVRDNCGAGNLHCIRPRRREMVAVLHFLCVCSQNVDQEGEFLVSINTKYVTKVRPLFTSSNDMGYGCLSRALASPCV